MRWVSGGWGGWWYEGCWGGGGMWGVWWWCCVLGGCGVGGAGFVRGGMRPVSDVPDVVSD